MIDPDGRTVKTVRAALLRVRHNELATVEMFCTGTAAKLERYAPLLAFLAKRKLALRKAIQRHEPQAGKE